MSVMRIIISDAELQELCEELNNKTYLALDTEFLRDKTYYPKLCLLQIEADSEIFLIDPITNNLDLTPILNIIYNPNILKILHSSRQDLEIFFNLKLEIPPTIFDTQIAASICGYGESASYESLVSRITGNQVDKTIRFSDWSNRPLSSEQLSYAACDVLYLREIYEFLKNKIQEMNRNEWLEEETAKLVSEANYINNIENAANKINIKGRNPKYIYILRELAKWREKKAQELDIPKAHLIKDETLFEIAAVSPYTIKDLMKVRNINTKLIGKIAGEIISIIKSTRTIDLSEIIIEKSKILPSKSNDIVELLKILLKIKSAEHQVAEKIIANNLDLALFVENNLDIPMLKGWRYEVFGSDALKLKNGKLGFVVQNDKLELIDV